MTRSQRGHIYKQDGYWYVRFRQNEVGPNGEIVRRQRALRLERVSREFPSKKSLEPRREEVLRERRVNSPEYNPQSTMTISQFVSDYFFPVHVARLKSPCENSLDFTERHRF